MPFSPAAADAAVRAALNTRGAAEGSDLGSFLEARLCSELRRVLLTVRRLHADRDGVTWGVTLHPIALQLTEVLPDAVEVATAEALEASAAAAATARRQAAAAAFVACDATGAAVDAADSTAAVAIGGATAPSSPREREAHLQQEGDAHLQREREAYWLRVAYWRRALHTLHSALVRQLLLDAINLPPALQSCARKLHDGYTTLADGARLTRVNGTRTGEDPLAEPIAASGSACSGAASCCGWELSCVRPRSGLAGGLCGSSGASNRPPSLFSCGWRSVRVT